MKIVGQKIDLRTIRITDAQSIAANINRKVAYYMEGMPFPYSVKDGERFVRDTQKKMKAKKVLRLGIEDKDTKQIIGMIGLENLDLFGKKGEIGYWLGEKYHRKGIMSEAVALLLCHAFKKMRLQRVYSRVAHQNIGSYKTLKKAGFKPEGRLCKHMRLRNKKYSDELRFGLLKEEYKES